jgi:hypothetical protein
MSTEFGDATIIDCSGQSALNGSGIVDDERINSMTGGEPCDRLIIAVCALVSSTPSIISIAS